MAKKAKDEEGDDLESPKKKGKLFLIIIIFVLVLLIGAGGYLGFSFFTKSGPFAVKGPTPEEIAAQRAKEEAEQAAKTKDMFIKFDKAFTFRLNGTRKRHMGQIEVVLMVSGPENADLAEKNKPLLQSAINDCLSEQNYETLLKPSGRQRLKNQVLDVVRGKMSEYVKAPVIEQVLFTGYVVQ